LFTRREWLPRILKIHNSNKQKVHLAFTNKYFDKVVGCLEPIFKAQLQRWRAGNRDEAKLRKYTEQLRKHPNTKMPKPVKEPYIPIPPALPLFPVFKKYKQLRNAETTRSLKGYAKKKSVTQLFDCFKKHLGLIKQSDKIIRSKSLAKNRVASRIGKLNIVFSLLVLPKTVTKYKSRYALHMRQLVNITHQRFFEYKLDRKLKAIKIHRRQSLEGLFIPRRVINTKVWRRLTIDQLMRKRKESLQLVKRDDKFKMKGFNKKTGHFAYHNKSKLSPLPVYANRRYNKNYKMPKKSLRLRLQEALTMHMSSSEKWTYTQNYKKNLKKAIKSKLENKIVQAMLTQSKKSLKYLASKYKTNYKKKITDIPDLKFKIKLARSVLKFKEKRASLQLKLKLKKRY